jgi:two-component system LytT family sensor kinase
MVMGGSISLGGWSGILGYLLPAVFIVPLIYFKMRFVFFDILIKRCLIAVMLLVTGALYCGLLLIPIYDRLSGERSTAVPLILYAGTTLFVAGWLALYSRLNLVLDRRLFRRSDYGKAIVEIDIAMKQFVEPSQLLNDVKSRLRAALDAESVEFIPRQAEPTGDVISESQSTNGTIQRQLLIAEIPVNTSEKSYGSLRFGKRGGRFRYQSEDLAFMTAVARRLAETLRNFDLQSEREAQQLREQHLQALAEQAELRALRAQINPHFLFNALTSLAELSQEDPRATEAAILHLSHVFRYALDASRHESAILEEELSFIESYLAIERLRFEDGLHYEITVSAEARGCRLPPMIIQPIVENAVKHGISRKLGGGTVKIEASIVEEKLWIEIEDDGLGFDPKSLGLPGRQGVGLENVRRRLEKIAGPGSFKITSRPNAGTKVCLELVCQRDTVSPKTIPPSYPPGGEEPL